MLPDCLERIEKFILDNKGYLECRRAHEFDDRALEIKDKLISNSFNIIASMHTGHEIALSIRISGPLVHQDPIIEKEAIQFLINTVAPYKFGIEPDEKKQYSINFLILCKYTYTDVGRELLRGLDALRDFSDREKKNLQSYLEPRGFYT